MSDNVKIGWAWIKGKQIPIFETREIKRGRDKGRFEVRFRVSKKVILDKSDITRWPKN